MLDAHDSPSVMAMLGTWVADIGAPRGVTPVLIRARDRCA